MRALYAAAKEARASRAELKRIAQVGKQLSDAIDLAVSTRPGTVGQRATWQHAEDATRRVGDLVDSLTPAEPLGSRSPRSRDGRACVAAPSTRRALSYWQAW